MAPRTIATGVLLGLLVGGIYIAIDLNQRQAARALAVAESAGPVAAAAAPAPTSAPAAPPRPQLPAARPAKTAAASPSAAAPNDAHPGMTLIPAANFKPSYSTREVEVSAFYIDTTLVTVEAYLACPDCARPPGIEARQADASPEVMPMVEVTWADAKHFCEWAKKRLPSEAEWELAARGPEGRKFAWGNEPPTDQLCWRRATGACPIGSFPKGDTPLGLKDMTGNVWQWTAEDSFCGNPGRPETCDKFSHTARGGAWNVFSSSIIEASYRNAMRALASYTGFRCAAE